MALLLFRKAKSSLSRLHPFPALERFKCSFVEEGGRAQFSSDTGMSSCSAEVSKWRKLDSRNLGISRWNISTPSFTVLKKLRDAGFDAYLVGGCVRDLILNKVPKDFDVITTAGLKQVKRKFARAIIIGRRFPICMVTIKGTDIEVSSFDTEAKEPKRRKVDISQIPKGCDPGDIVRWKNCMNRDFTVNSLLFDPFKNVILDYTDAMRDLRSLKLRTVIPAELSFIEDQARILRGLRLAARLNLSFSKETEDALHSLSSSVTNLSKSRINLEMNYMFSYGAAEPSLLLLKRFKLLEILLPFHAAYLSKQVDNGFRMRSLMLMKLLFNLDQLITCNQPCKDSLWVAILVFHMAIFANPQHAVVALTLAELLCHRTWEDSMKFARKHAQTTRIYVPEILDAFDHLSDDEIVKRVTSFAGQVANSVGILINKYCLLEAMAGYPELAHSSLLFVSQATEKRVKHIVNISSLGVDPVKAAKRSNKINYGLLSKGDEGETRFVLGKIIFRTLVRSNNRAEKETAEDEKDDTNPPHNSMALDQKSQPKSDASRKRKLHHSENLAEKETTEDDKDDTLAMNLPYKSKVLDQKTSPKSAGPRKLHATGKNAKKASKTQNHKATNNSIATDSGTPGSTGKNSNESVNDETKYNTHVLSGLFK